MKTYSHIRALVGQLESSRISERRDASQQLQRKLGLLEVRSNLALEAASGYDTKSRLRQKKALTRLWRYVITTAVVSTQNLVFNSKAKLTEADITLPFSLAQSCCAPHDNLPDPPGTLPFENTFLSPTELKLILSFADKMLQSDKALDIAERKILEGLAFLCSRKEYVAQMRPRKEVRWIVEEVESRILQEDMKIQQLHLAEQAGKVFRNLIETNTHLGIEMVRLIPGCVKMVAQCCEEHKNKSNKVTIPSLLPPLLKGLAALVKSNIDLSIAPMTRHGRPILSFIKRFYRLSSTTDSQQALQCMILAHVQLAERAGKLQGRMPGDLGDMGKASLTGKQITLLLDMLIGDVYKRGAGEDCSLLMELIARLLKCAQREYLVATDWLQYEMRNADLNSWIETGPPEPPNECSTSDFSKSPFAEGILVHLLLPQLTDTVAGPYASILSEMKRSTDSEPKRSNILSSLRIILACAKSNPSGACWTSSLHHWIELRDPVDFGSFPLRDMVVEDIIQANSCSSSDMALLIFMVANVLEWSGVAGGDEAIQKTALQCLHELTGPSAIILNESGVSLKPDCQLRSQWRRVWKILVRSDLRYARDTQTMKQDITGRMVIEVLTRIVQRCCVDVMFKTDEPTPARRTSFVYMHQEDIWKLPVYSSHGYGGLAALELVYAVLANCGLCETGEDSIGFEDAGGSSSGIHVPQNRRGRLLRYCAGTTARPESWVAVAAASACMLALTSGTACTELMTRLQEEQMDATRAPWSETPARKPSRMHTDFLLLWSQPCVDPRTSFGYARSPYITMAEKHEESALRYRLSELDSCLSCTEFVPNSFKKQVMSSIEKICRESLHADDNVVETVDLNDDKIQDLKNQIYLLKVRLSLSLLPMQGDMEMDKGYLTDAVRGAFRSVSATLEVLQDNTSGFCFVFAHIFGVVLVLTSMVSRGKIDWLNDVAADTASLTERCEAVLDCAKPATGSEESSSYNPDDSFLDKSNVGDDDMSDEAGRDFSPSRKRKMSTKPTPNKKFAAGLHLPNPRCVSLVAMVIWSLKSMPGIESRLKSLIGVSSLSQDSIESSDIDVMAVVLFLKLLCSDTSLVRSLQTQNRDRLVDVVDKFHRTLSVLNSITRAHDDFFLAGFFACDNIVQFRELFPLEEDEAETLVDCLLQDGDEYKRCGRRPGWRFQRLLSALRAFRGGRSKFHKAFDKQFASQLVLPSMHDLDAVVRRVSGKAVGSAIRLLPGRKVIESIRKRLPVLWSNDDNNYKRWYNNTILKDTNEEDFVEPQLWEDAFLSIQDSTLYYWCEVAGATSNIKALGECVFSIARTASRIHGLEGLCFLALDKIRFLRGYSTVEALFAVCAYNVLERWVHAGFRFRDLPLCLTAPPLMRHLVRAGHMARLQEQSQMSSEVDTTSLRNFASVMFVKAHRHFAVPIVCGFLTTNRVSEESSIHWGELLTNDVYVSELCSTENEHLDTTHVLRLFTENIGSLLAYISWVSSGESHENVNAGMLQRCVMSIITEPNFERLSRASFDISLVHLLEHSLAAENCTSDRYLAATKRLTELSSSVCNSSSFIFLVLHAKTLLKDRVRSMPAAAAWLPIEWVLDNVISHACDEGKPSSVMNFVVEHLVVGLMDDKLKDVRSNCLHSLQIMIDEVDGMLETRSGYADTIENLLHVVFHLCDDTYLAIQTREKALVARVDELFIASRGLVGVCYQSENGPSERGWVNFEPLGGFPESATQSQIPTNQLRTWNALKSILGFLISRATSGSWLKAKLEHAYKLSDIRSNHSSALGGICKFEPFQTLNSESSSNPREDTARHDIRACFENIARAQKSSRNAVSLNERATIRSLEDLHESLVDANIGRGPDLFLDCRHIKAVLELCSSGANRDVRLSASRCLGELDFSSLQWHIDSGDSWIHKSLQSDRLSRSLIAKCVEALAQISRSIEASRALRSVTALQGLLVTRCGRECLDCIEDSAVRGLADLFVQKSDKEKFAMFSFRLAERDILKFKNRMGIVGGTGDLWCLSPEAWRPSTLAEVPFEDWLCGIVAALVFYLFNPKDDQTSNARPQEEFFVRSQKVAYFESSFAAALFPAMVTDLMHRDIEAEVSGEDQTSSFRNDLSRCFEAFLEDFNNVTGGISYQGNLVIDTVDLLRQYTQRKFMLQKRRRPQRHAESNSMKQPATTPLGERAIQWKGLQFGVVVKIDELLLARACLKVGRPTLALFYTEMYADRVFGGSTAAKVVIKALSADQTTSRVRGADMGKMTQPSDECRNYREFLEVLRQCYEATHHNSECISVSQFISDLSILSTQHSVMTSVMGGAPMLALSNGDSAMDTDNIVQSLDELGLYFTLDTFVSGLRDGANQPTTQNSRSSVDEKWQKCRLLSLCWGTRTSKEGQKEASFLPSNSARGEGQGYLELVRLAAEDLRSCDYSNCVAHINEARCRLLSTHAPNLESLSPRNLAFHIIKFRALNELQRFAEQDAHESLQIVRRFDDSSFFQSSDIDLSIHLRELILRHAQSSTKSSAKHAETASKLLDHLWHTSWTSLQRNDLVSAANTIKRIQCLLQEDSQLRSDKKPILLSTLRLRLHEAKFLEKSGSFTLSIRSLQRIIEHMKPKSDTVSAEAKGLLSEIMIYCGGLMARYKTEPARTVLSAYLMPGKDLSLGALEMECDTHSIERASEGLLEMSSLAFSILDTVLQKTKSYSFSQSEKILDGRRQDYMECIRQQKDMETELKRGKRKDEDLERKLKEHRIYLLGLGREIKQMEAELQETTSSTDTYLKMTLLSISKALILIGNRNKRGLTEHVYRMAGVWFSAVDEDRYSEGVDAIMLEAVENIPSFRLVSLANQIFARLESHDSVRNESSQNRVHSLILRLCHDHPYHCLIHLVAACNGIKVGKGVDGRNASAFIGNSSESKIEAAMEIRNALTTKDPDFIAGLIESYSTLSNAYIQLAETEVRRTSDKQSIRFSSLSLKGSDRLDVCLHRRDGKYAPCVLTNLPSLRPGCDYHDGIEDPINGERIAGFENAFKLTSGGVHEPKIVVCQGTKGGAFRQLVKGQDEIRQDAVMQQVFGLVNEFASEQRENDLEPKKQLITYTIVPLTPTCGVLEWVEDSVPFGDLIVESKRKDASHSRYFPGEWKTTQCREQMKNSKREQRREVFDLVCSYYSPSFRYFFLEKFGHEAEKWHDAKIRYTRSVAVNSMVGHVLGIGDRHCSNILVHEKSGELIHIDFGIVFEQGKLLALPEKVPFRLTRNVVDGMGIMGTDGTFTETSESTLDLLRKNSAALLTILSAIANDPLYKWKLSPKRRAESAGSVSRQGRLKDETDFEGKNEAASRAISRVYEKLQGYEDGTAGERQSVKGQVQLLVNQARDYDNLCQMFYGWQPWV